MSKLTIEDREKILQEEKEYWQKQTLTLRAICDDMADTLRKQTNELLDLRAESNDQGARLHLITEIQKAMKKTGAPMTDWHLGGITYDALSEVFTAVTNYEAPPVKPAPLVDMSKLVLVAWRNGTNGSLYEHRDPRPHVKNGKRPAIQQTSKGKIPLYALRGTAVIIEPDMDDLAADMKE